MPLRQSVCRMMKGYLIALLVSIGACYSDICQDVYYVVAPGSESLCPEGVECNVLSSYLSGSVSFDCFVEDVVFYFLEGTHSLNQFLLLSDVTNITLQGVSQHNKETGIGGAKIVCNSYGSVILVSSAHVSMASLSFSGCGNLDQPALYFKNVSGLYLNHITVQSSSLGLIADNCMELIMSSSFFNSNSYGHIVVLYDSKCYDTDTVVKVSIQSSRFLTTFGAVSHFRGDGIGFLLEQGQSYFVDITMSDIIVSDSWASNMAILVSASSLHSINMNQIVISGSGKGGGSNSSGVSYFTKEDSTSNCTSSFQPTSTPIVFNMTIFKDNTGQYGGGLMFDLRHSAYGADQRIMIDSCDFYHNKGELIGIAIGILACGPEVIIRNTTVSDNNGSLINASAFINTVAAINCTLTLEDVVIANNPYSGLATYESLVKFKGKGNKFHNNTGYNGGGFALWGGSRIFLYPNTTVYFESNHAVNRGGGAYWDSVLDDIFSEDCSNHISNNGNASGKEMLFLDNTAGATGNDIFGLRNINVCRSVVDIRGIKNTITFASQGVGICLCDSDGINCSNSTNTFRSLSGYAGQVIDIHAALHGWSYKNNNCTVYPTTDGIAAVGNYNRQEYFVFDAGCKTLSYTVRSPSAPGNVTVDLSVYSDQYSQFKFIHPEDFSTVTMLINIEPCPIGFQILNMSDTCGCSEVVTMITDANVTCNITNQTFQRAGDYWIGIKPGTQCIVNAPCAALYCNDGINTFSMNDTDSQCSEGRTGLLCGSCVDGWSLKLGGQSCEKCSNWYLFLIIPFALAGIALLLFINVTDFLVSLGAVNGVIFYANVVKLYEPIIFPNGPVTFLRLFISWLNLDLGISICFYNGMNATVRAYLQFVFPFYIWLIVFFIILVSRRFTRLSKMIGTNAVPVLATVLLLSYTKLFQTVLSALHYLKLVLHCEDKVKIMYTWYDDPQIMFTSSAHLALVVMSLAVMVILCLPYTLFLLFSPVVENYLWKYKCFKWTSRLKPLFDAYNGAYKDKCRFWTGVLLLARLPLIIATAVAENPNFNRNLLLSVLGTVIVLLLTFALCLGGLYQKNIHNILESWYLLNIALVAVISINSPQAAQVAGVVSCSLVFVTFFGTLALNVYLKYRKRVAKQIVNMSKKITRKQSQIGIHVENEQEIGLTYIDIYNDEYHKDVMKPHIIGELKKVHKWNSFRDSMFKDLEID